MVSSKYGARLSERDVEQLDSASTALASAAAAIRRANPSWGEAVIQALILANQVIERLRDRGATAFTRHLERRGLLTTAKGAETGAAVAGEAQPPFAPPVKPEEP